MEIHQILAASSYGDAITNEAIALRDIFRRVGPSEIYSGHQDGRVRGVKQLDQYPREGGSGGVKRVLVLHHSIGEPAVARLLAERPEPLVLRYHNITPPAFFASYDPEFAKLLASGREELSELRDRVAIAVADSQFNANELRELGYPEPVVVPLVIDATRLMHLRSEVPPQGLPATGHGPVVLFVGRIAPNKGQHLLLQAFHILKTYLRPDAHLLLVGKASQPAYVRALEQFVRELALPEVTFMGQVTDAELAAIYRRADVFCCLSAHEGFGVPLVESMAFGVPIVAWAATAVRETLGNAALLLDEPRPALVAECLNRLVDDQHLRRYLVARGKERARELDPSRSAQRFLEQVQRASGAPFAGDRSRLP